MERLMTEGDTPAPVEAVIRKALNGSRITPEEGLLLYQQASLSLLGLAADVIRGQKHGQHVYFNRNFHIEPTNKCVFDCKFCAYSRKIQQEEDAWELNEQEILDRVRKYEGQPVTEVHIVGGVHPKMSLHYFAGVLHQIRALRPDLHIKAFTAVELDYMFRKAKVSAEEGFALLKENGLGSIPGGGAEIFAPEVREKICADKADGDTWLRIHETAHRMGIPSNCTMLYGHIETYAHRIDHMNRLRELQDRTHGFNTFIPLKFRHEHSQMDYLPEVSITEDLRCYAVSRIFLDNIPHLKAYWPMMGRQASQLLLHFGVDDMDGTIDDSTRIYSMAGAEEQRPALSTCELVELIRGAGREAIERDTLYQIRKDWTKEVFETAESVNPYSN